MKLLLIGCGNMGSAMATALVDELIFDDIEVFDRHSDKGEALNNVTVVGSPEEAFIDEETVVLIAVKPQDIDSVMEGLCGRYVDGALLISIVAGVSVERLHAGTGWDAIVRAMPNTPALIGEGASAWFASENVTDMQRALVRNVFESFGTAIEVKTEDDIDRVTALSGSGPAYVFYFLEALVEGATALGLDEKQALTLAVQTLIGSAEMARSVLSVADLKQLRANVTSKGGTTEQAMRVFDEQAFKAMVRDAMQAAYARAKKLR